MIKYFCDKCGKELSDDIFANMFEIKINSPEIQTWDTEAEIGTHILCYSCVRKLNKWINKKDDFVK